MGGATGGGGSEMCPVGSVCVPEPAMGALVTNAPGGICPTGWSTPTDVYADNNLPGCNNNCSCSAPAGGSCTLGMVTSYNNDNCTNVKAAAMAVTAGQCVDVSETNANNQADSYMFPPPTFNAGTCTGMGADMPPVEPFGAFCSLSQEPTNGGCMIGEVCVPEPNPDSGECILLEGDQSCPSPYDVKSLAYLTVNDTRVCACDCGTDDGTCSQAEIELWGNDSCSTNLLDTQAASMSCYDASSHQIHDSFVVTGGAYTAGTCSEIETDTGEVTLMDERTICCQP